MAASFKKSMVNSQLAMINMQLKKEIKRIVFFYC